MTLMYSLKKKKNPREGHISLKFCFLSLSFFFFFIEVDSFSGGLGTAIDFIPVPLKNYCQKYLLTSNQGRDEGFLKNSTFDACQVALLGQLLSPQLQRILITMAVMNIFP